MSDGDFNKQIEAMKLEVGKTYKARNGEKVEIVEIWFGHATSGNKQSYSLSGRARGCDHEHDLISEWKEKSMELSDNKDVLKAAVAMLKEIERFKALQVEEVLDFTWFEPEIGDEYWYVNCNGDVNWACWDGYDTVFDQERLAQGNVYRTEREATIISENRATIVELKKLAGDFVPDWDDEEQEKWYIGYDFEDDEAVVDSRCYLGSGEHPYFRSRSEGKEAADKVGHERIKQLKQYGVI